ncbi:protein phosphatase 2C domain-containing protein [Gilliamella apicola]|uniref:Protein phosphatase 2C domain-containing protein n=1 Tax=Gilliamella apicola TaxID=1196095 RepID=A0A2V4E476_9GAMM|nr:PP2C family serine/threonine-protein phosphatase [Gilliamella apicola]PXZ08055.1 protein phosphatase 2C domain-containing protein [Gilliamella apicola]
MTSSGNIYQKIISAIITDISQDLLEQLIKTNSITVLIDQAIETITTTYQQLKSDNSSQNDDNQSNFTLPLAYVVPITHWLELKPEKDVQLLKFKELQKQNTSNDSSENLVSDRKSPISYSPRFHLPNMKVGNNYSAKIEIDSPYTDAEIIIENILINQPDLNLTFNKQTNTIEGTPTISGTFTLDIIWKVTDGVAQTTKIDIIINPDPDSLWKNIPADENDIYYKPSLAHQFIETEQLKIAAASCRGRSHAHVGSFRDDDFFIDSLSNGWNITIVADGAGSAKNSRKGSQLAVNTVGQYLKHQLLDSANQDLLSCVKKWDHASTQSAGTQFKTWFRDAILLAIKQLEVEADKTNRPLKSYSTTLLIAVTLKMDNDLFAATFSVGDGAIAAFSYKDNIRLLANTDNGEFAGQTRFLDNSILREADFYSRIRIGKWPEINYFLLMTDGISDPKFETDFQLNNKDKWLQLIDELNPYLATPVNPAEALLDWMKFSSPGHHDDRTLIVIW